MIESWLAFALQTVGLVVIIIGFALRQESRLTKLETKLDMLLNPPGGGKRL